MIETSYVTMLVGGVTVKMIKFYQIGHKIDEAYCMLISKATKNIKALFTKKSCPFQK